jgi:parallel beta-helix repeat protein
MKRKQLSRIILVFLTFFILVELTLTTAAGIDQTLQKNQQTPQPIITTNNKENLLIVDSNGIYTSIQDAIDNAPSEATILIKPGTYTEILTIQKSITLQGENKKTTIISPTSRKNSYAIKINTPGVTLSNLDLTNNGPGLYTTAIHVSAPNTKIENCNIHDTPIGIAIWSSDNTIKNCNFWGCTDEGIALLGSTVSPCDNNLITNCKFYNNCDGIELQHASYNTISNCIIHDNTHTGIDAITQANNHNTITDCDIFNNEVHGIYLAHSTSNTIRNCKLAHNDNGAITLIGSTYTTITHCELDHQSYLHLYDQSTATIDHCTIKEEAIKTKNSEYSIVCQDASPLAATSDISRNTPNLSEFLTNTEFSRLRIRDLIQLLIAYIF